MAKRKLLFLLLMLMNFYHVLLFLQYGDVRHNALQGKLFLQVPTQCLM